MIWADSFWFSHLIEFCLFLFGWCLHRFTSDVKLKSISVVGGADGTSPVKMRAWVPVTYVSFKCRLYSLLSYYIADFFQFIFITIPWFLPTPDSSIERVLTFQMLKTCKLCRYAFYHSIWRDCTCNSSPDLYNYHRSGNWWKIYKEF